MKWLSASFWRSTQGQLLLLAGTFVGAVGLALATIIVRDMLFEPYLREQFAADDERFDRLARDLAAGNAGPGELTRTVDELAEALATRDQRGQRPEGIDIDERYRVKARTQLVSGCYRHWLMGEDGGANSRLLRALLTFDADQTRRVLKRTLVVGDPQQRSKALAGLAVAGEYEPIAAAELARFARERARRRGETDLAEHADTVLKRLQPER